MATRTSRIRCTVAAICFCSVRLCAQTPSAERSYGFRNITAIKVQVSTFFESDRLQFQNDALKKQVEGILERRGIRVVQKFEKGAAFLVISIDDDFSTPSSVPIFVQVFLSVPVYGRAGADSGESFLATTWQQGNLLTTSQIGLTNDIQRTSLHLLDRFLIDWFQYRDK